MRYLCAITFMFAVGVSEGRAETSAGPAHTITIENVQFAAPDITVKVGEPVEWVNNDLVPHTVTAVDGSVDSDLILPGHTWNLVLKVKGTFAYRCKLHPAMSGVIHVE